VASRDGVSPATVRRDAEFAEAADAVIEKAPELKEPIERGTIPKTAVRALADAPKTELKKLGKLVGTELRKAASQAAKRPRKKPKAGRQKKDPRIWKEIEQQLGKALNRVDELHKQCPNKPMHLTLLRQIKQAMKTLEGWKESVK